MKIDLHNHLGRNGKNPGFDETINLVYNRLGNNSMFGITNCPSGDYRFENFTKQKGKYTHDWLDEEKRILFIPEKQIYIMGTEEVQTKQGHLLVAGMPSNKKIQKTDKTLFLEDALKSADDFNGIKIAVHPFSKDGLGNYLNFNQDLCSNFDGWEVYNASAELAILGILPKDANKNSIEFYNSVIRKNFDVGTCAFTDGHSVEVIGRSYSDYYCIVSDSLGYLKQRIKQNKSFDNLHMEPAKLDALKHAYNIAKDRAFKTGA